MRTGSTEKAVSSKCLLVSTSKAFLLLDSAKTIPSSPTPRQVEGHAEGEMWAFVLFLCRWLFYFSTSIHSPMSIDGYPVAGDGCRRNRALRWFTKEQFWSLRIHPDTLWNLVHTFSHLKQNIHTEPADTLESFRKKSIDILLQRLLLFLVFVLQMHF